jgi:hypothetical protein
MKHSVRSASEKQRTASNQNNRKTRNDPDETLPEYDFSHSRPNKYASCYAESCRTQRRSTP